MRIDRAEPQNKSTKCLPVDNPGNPGPTLFLDVRWTAPGPPDLVPGGQYSVPPENAGIDRAPFADPWDVVVTTPSGSSATLTGGFTVVK